MSQLRLMDRRINEIHDDSKAGSGVVEKLKAQLQEMGAYMKQKVSQEDLRDLRAAVEQQRSSINQLSADKADSNKVEALAMQLQATEAAILTRRGELVAIVDSKIQKYGQQLQKV